MKTISEALTIAKNSQSQEHPWIPVIEVTLTDEPATILRFAQNTEDITYNGEVYTAMPFIVETILSNNKGEMPEVTLKIQNVTRLIQPYLTELSGAMGSTVLLTVVNTGLLSEDYAEIELSFTVIGCKADAKWVTWTLGTPKLLRQRFPLYEYQAMHCDWDFKSVECGYVGVDTICERTLIDCRTKSNSPRFGGCTGLRTGAMRVA